MIAEGRVATHTQTSTDCGPDYCDECSRAAQEWVRWPCEPGRSLSSTSTTEGAGAVMANIEQIKARHAELDQGVIEKYTVQRNGDTTGKHDDCWFFVLDIKHDPLAHKALAAYRDAASEAGYAPLAADLSRRLAAAVTAGRTPSPCPRCGHAVMHTAKAGCMDCSCDLLVDWLGPNYDLNRDLNRDLKKERT